MDVFALTKKYATFLVWVEILFFVLVYGFMSVNNHRLFETQGWDLAVFDSGIWQWSKFKFPFSSFHNLPWLADHFHLILVTLAPFYWFWSDARVLLIAQAFLISFGALPLYFLSQKVTRNHLFSLVAVLGYLLYFSLQWHMFSGFHELTFLPITLGGVMYFWEARNWKWYWIFFGLALLVKEEVGFLLAAFAVWEVLTNKKERRVGVASFVVGVGFSLLLIYKLMPLIGGQPYRHLGYGTYGETPDEVFTNLVKNPLIIFKAFTDSSVKLNTMFTNFWPWAFLPLFSPTTLIPALQQYALRFLDYVKVIRWTPYYAYSLPIATISTWGSIYGFKSILTFVKRKYTKYLKFVGTAVPIGLLGLILIQQVALHAPINSIFKRAFYRTEKWMRNNQRILACIPSGASLSAQNSLASHVSHREQINIFPEGLTLGYEYVLVDLHPGQNENNFYFFGSENTKFVVNDLIKRGLYEIVCKEGDSLVLKKKVDTRNQLNYPFPLDIYEH